MTENNDYSYLLDIINLVDNNEAAEEVININYEGDFAVNKDIKDFNSNLVFTLLKDGSFNLSISEKSKINSKTDKSIKELFNKPQEKVDLNFQFLENPQFIMPEQGHWICVSNWEFGFLPQAWLEPINDYVDEIWVSSNYTKDSYINSGINPDKIKIINYGTDTLIFNPNIEKTSLKGKKTKLLYKGDLGWKSGFDILLKAFTDEFSSEDEISLIVIPDSENINKQQLQKIKEYSNNNDNPEILVFENVPEINELAKIYSTVDFIVLPYRTEKIFTDVVNAMACSTPAIINADGVSKDYCNEDNSLLVKSEKIYNSSKNIENIVTVNYPYWHEVKLNSLRIALRNAYEITAEKYEELSKNASKFIINNFTYIKISENVKKNISDVLKKPVKRSIQNQLNLDILEGLNNLTQGNYDASLTALQKALELNPDSENANFYLANLMMLKENYNKALEYIVSSLKKNSEHEDYNNLIGIVLYKLGDYKLAEEFFIKTLRLMPEHAGAQESLKAVKVIKMSQFDNKDTEYQRELIKSFIDRANKISNPTLSVCIIAKNEEKTIERTIKSVKSFADEIIVIDTGSTDKTVKIVEAEKVKLYHHEWNNDFAEARNKSLEYATKDWILMLDADEYIDIEHKENIKALLENLDNSKIYEIKVVNFLDKNNINEKIEHYVTRLIPNNRGVKFIRSIHEYPVNQDNSNIDSEVLDSFQIYHTGYLKKQVKEKNKIIRNRNIIENLLTKNPESLIDYFYLSENYKEEDNYEKVVELSEKVVELSPKFPEYENIIKITKINLIESYIVLNDYKTALLKADEFEKDLEKRPDYWFLKGSIEYNLNNFDKAIDYQKKALSLKDADIYPTIDTGTISWKPLALIAESYIKKEDYNLAITYYKKALKEAPDNFSFYYKLTELYAKLDQIQKMELMLKEYINVIPPYILSEIIETVYNKYLENNAADMLYKLLEYVRQTKSNEKDNKILVEKLIEIYRKLQSIYPDMMAIKYSIACCYENIKDYDKAEQIFNEIGGDEIDSQHNLASIAFSRNDLEKAENIYKNVLKKDEFHIGSYIGLIKIEFRRGNFEQAHDYISELKLLDPDNKEVQQIEFEIAKASGDKKLASDMYASMLFKGNFLN